VRHTSRSAFEVMCDKPFCFACSSGGGDADREGGAPFYLACPSGSGTGAPLLHCTPPSPRIGGAHRRGRMAGPLQIGRTRMTHSGASTPHASTSPFATRCGTPFPVDAEESASPSTPTTTSALQADTSTTPAADHMHSMHATDGGGLQHARDADACTHGIDIAILDLDIAACGIPAGPGQPSSCFDAITRPSPLGESEA
jgi:hypothetical protein